MGGNPSSAWRNILKGIVADVGRKKVSLMAAGVAFYGVLSVAPIMAGVVSLYGLAYEPAAVQAQVAALSGIVPEEALGVIHAELARVVSTNHSQLGLGLVVSLLVALGTASSGTSALMTALNVAYATDEERGLVEYCAYCVLLAIGLLVFGSLSLALLALTPAIVSLLPVGRLWAEWLRWPALAVLAWIAITTIYRYGPSRNAARPRWVSWAAIAATVLWIAGSALFSVYLHFGVYVGKFPENSEAYDAFGAVLALLLWLWLSVLAVLIGGVLDANMARALNDTTIRPQ